MRRAKWVVFVLALGMIAATAGWLKELQGRQLLGPPGVKVGPVPIYCSDGRLVSTQSVVLPASVMGIPSVMGLVSPTEMDSLPKDTTFGRRFYTNIDVQLSVVLMGTDHTSIHQPQYCLYAQDWNVLNAERITLPMQRPFADIPAYRLTASQRLQKSGQMIECLYVYWFVSGNNITAEEGSRLWSMWKTVLREGKMERWAYISYFATCLPGQEQATFERLEKFIRASAPEFQLVTGQPAVQQAPPSAKK